MSTLINALDSLSLKNVIDICSLNIDSNIFFTKHCRSISIIIILTFKQYRVDIATKTPLSRSIYRCTISQWRERDKKWQIEVQNLNSIHLYAMISIGSKLNTCRITCRITCTLYSHNRRLVGCLRCLWRIGKFHCYSVTKIVLQRDWDSTDRCSRYCMREPMYGLSKHNLMNCNQPCHWKFNCYSLFTFW